jgi:uncharacterized membrane protein
METKSKLLGHPVHPMLVVFPLALFSIAVLFDALYLVTGSHRFADDWWQLPKGTRARSLGLWHGLGNALLFGPFIVSWYLRLAYPDYAYAPDWTPFVLSLVGVSLMLGTAWLGGELVYRLGMAVDSGANPDAPSSLSGKPAVRTADESRGTTGAGTHLHSSMRLNGSHQASSNTVSRLASRKGSRRGPVQTLLTRRIGVLLVLSRLSRQGPGPR